MMASAVPKRKSLMTPLVTTAGVLGIIQGLGWTLCSIVGILFYTEIIPTASTNGIGYSIYSFYLSKEILDKYSESIIGSSQFSYFLYIHLALSLCWLLISSVLLWASITGKGHNFYGKAIGGWTLITGLVSLLDLILVGLISYDYDQYKNKGNADTTEITAIGIVITLAARGFVLWIVNVVFAIILGKYCHKLYKKDVGNRNRPPIDAYATAPVPWLDPSLYNDSGSNDLRPYPEADPIRPYSYTPPARTAKIGKQAGQRSPPLNVAPPFIPDPDYSPPGSPKVKGVLRPKSNYADYNMY
ncbi:unnamed protein product [Ceutorhynchus assimilis]|uniref:Uncharacterized protein n=1 Tax=Ceutorhynchus assimilis TaxID=467358 RepID=A0A9N9QM37_9CUCU|nr:unnamed protein product [Ceutorhynchus assimilis]